MSEEEVGTVLWSGDNRGLAGEHLFAFEGVRRAGQPRTESFHLFIYF